jgi:hypothetical protein
MKSRTLRIASIARRLCAFPAASRGGVSILNTFSLVGMIGAIALSVELGQGYVALQANQSTADMAALGGANAYAANQDQTVLLATANDIANANGAETSRVTAAFIAGYENTGRDVIRVDVRSTIPLYFAQILNAKASYTVNSTGVAALPSAQSPACIMALAPGGKGISIKGGATLAASDCTISSNASTQLSGGARITGKALTTTGDIKVDNGSIVSSTDVTYGGATSIQAGSAITGKRTHRAVSVTDPFAGDPTLAAAFNALGTHATPAKATVATGEDLTLGYYPTTMTFQGRTSSLVNNVWRFPAGSYVIRNLNTQGLTLEIAGPSVVTVSGTVTIGGGGKLIVGDGPISIPGAINLAGGTSMSLGKGRKLLGPITIGGGSSLTLGDGDLDVDGPINVGGGGSRMTVGLGNVTLGASGGKSIDLSGGSELRFSDGRFSTAGSIVTSGGTTLAIGDTATHYINGNLDLSGTALLGKGLYLINGSFTNHTGGALVGTDLTFILKNPLGFNGGTGINLSAPGANSSWGIPGILFASLTSGTTAFGGGAMGRYSGALYFPNSDFELTGGAGLSSSCFMLIVNSITIHSGPTASSTCPGLKGASTGSGNATLIR